MGNISIKQILIVLLISLFLFGDLFNVKKKLQKFLKIINKLFFKK